eukprot:COSAG05_NODE_6140_length_1014_cov_0.945355_2_plen_46_part_01
MDGVHHLPAAPVAGAAVQILLRVMVFVRGSRVAAVGLAGAIPRAWL